MLHVNGSSNINKSRVEMILTNLNNIIIELVLHFGIKESYNEAKHNSKLLVTTS